MSNFLKNILITALGGIGLFASTIFLQAFFTSPPSRAEFDSFKATIIQQNNYIEKRLDNIDKKQDAILENLIKKEN